MADNVAITAGSGTTVAADEVVDGTLGTVKVQYVKLMDGTLDGTGKAAVDATKGLAVDPKGSATAIKLASAGLTTSVTAYTAGDVLGTELSFANAVRLSGGTATIVSATLIDAAKVLGAVDLYLFGATSTPASDNAANAWADSDAANQLGMISFGTPIASANNSSAVAVAGLPLVIACAATTLFGTLVTRTANAIFGAVGDITIRLGIAQD